MRKNINIEKDQLYLIFINKIGLDCFGQSLYEFVFSKDTKEITGESWDSTPAQGNPQPPNKRHIEKIGSIKTDEFELEVIQDSPFFCMNDCQDGVISLAWEILTDDKFYFETDRLIFYWGEPENSVIDKLSTKNITFENKKLKQYEKENS